MKHAFYVIADGTIYGFGDTENEAVLEAREWLGPEYRELTAETILRCVGGRNSSTGSWPRRGWMTQCGELTNSDVVLVDADTADEMGVADA